ncbi:MAG TPA: hypothetical protein VL551_25100, partial [Actinospica sp.]|nr:hypothetical protein [Actinospica sp.]
MADTEPVRLRRAQHGVDGTEHETAEVDAEPGELRAHRPWPHLTRLIADQLTQFPPLPETARALPSRVRRDFTEHGAAYLYGVRAAVLVALCGWLVAASLTLLLWA